MRQCKLGLISVLLSPFPAGSWPCTSPRTQQRGYWMRWYKAELVGPLAFGPPGTPLVLMGSSMASGRLRKLMWGGWHSSLPSPCECTQRAAEPSPSLTTTKWKEGVGVGPVSTLLSSPLGLVGPSGELGFLVQSAVIKHYVTSLIAHSSGGSGARQEAKLAHLHRA